MTPSSNSKELKADVNRILNMVFQNIQYFTVLAKEGVTFLQTY
tara:strand:+ start:898 stop:1026 length:129 start_codon:yes stop_codon:yes gene_type:complete